MVLCDTKRPVLLWNSASFNLQLFKRFIVLSTMALLQVAEAWPCTVHTDCDYPGCIGTSGPGSCFSNTWDGKSKKCVGQLLVPCPDPQKCAAGTISATGYNMNPQGCTQSTAEPGYFKEWKCTRGSAADCTYPECTAVVSRPNCHACPSSDDDECFLWDGVANTFPSYFCGSKNFDVITLCPQPSICPAGTFSESGYNIDDQSCAQCDTCSSGQYISTPCNGLTSTVSCSPCHAPCSAGSYINLASCTGSTFSNSAICSQCNAQQGYFCPAGSIEGFSQLCPPGYYCLGGAEDKAQCSVQEGYYCPEESTSAVGVQCPSGHFCVGGTADKVQCTAQQGYFCPAGATSGAGVQCPSGHYCSGGAADKAQCSAQQGYYCSTGSANGAGMECLSGYYCSGGAADKVQVSLPV